jgi:hypothetical protein
LKQVTILSICYCLVYLNQITWLITSFIIGRVMDRMPISIELIAMILYPLNGFFNAAIYIQPRIRTVRRKYDKLPLLQAVRHVLADRSLQEIQSFLQQEDQPEERLETNHQETSIDIEQEVSTEKPEQCPQSSSEGSVEVEQETTTLGNSDELNR